MSASFEVISSFNHRSLMNRSRSDLEYRLGLLARAKGLCRNDIVDAIMLLSRRLSEFEPCPTDPIIPTTSDSRPLHLQAE